jgi:hypothetical protein
MAACTVIGAQDMEEIADDVVLIDVPPLDALDELQRAVVRGLRRPGPGARARRPVRDDRLQGLGATVATEIERILTPAAVPGDLTDRLIAIPGGADGYDALIARYRAPRWQIQLAALRSRLCIVARADAVTGPPREIALTLADELFGPLDGANDRPGQGPTRWLRWRDRTWRESRIGALWVWTQPPTSDWAGTVTMFSDGRAAAFAIARSVRPAGAKTRSAPSPEAERAWLRESGRHS